MTTKRQLQKTYRKLLVASGHKSFRDARSRWGELAAERTSGRLGTVGRWELDRLLRLARAWMAREHPLTCRANRRLAAWLERIIGSMWG